MKRKTLLALVILIVSATAAKAQIQKGDVLLGAALGVSSNNNNLNGSSSNAGIAPRIGFAIGRNSVMGINTSFAYSRTKPSDNNNTWENKGFNVGAGLYWRKYIPLKDKLGWYVESDLAFGYAKSKQTSGQQKIENTSTGYGVSAVPGFYYQALPKLFLHVEAGGINYIYSVNKNSDDSKSKSSSVYLSLFNSFTFGVDFLLTKGKNS